MTEHASQRGGTRASLPTLPDVLRDPDTGLPNRMFFDAVFGTIFHIGKRGLPVSLVVFRVPGAAEVGRDALGGLGGRLRDVTRQSDLKARVGRDEAVLVLLDCNIHGGRIVAERVVEDLAGWAAPHGLTVRGGVATYTDAMDVPSDLLEEARNALERGTGPVEVA